MKRADQGVPSLATVGCLFLFWAATGAAAPITNGLEVESGEFPQVVALDVHDGHGFLRHCSGTIVGPNTVLTAAHCLEGVDPQKFKIAIFIEDQEDAATEFFLDPKSDSTEEERLIDAADKFKPWNRLTGEERTHLAQIRSKILELARHDLAVVKLAAPASFKDYIPIQAVAPASFVDWPVTLVGYGIATANPKRSNSYKRKGSTRILASGHGLLVTIGLTASRGFLDHATPNAAAKADGQDAALAQGDSGGPMLSEEGNVIGVNAFFSPGLELALNMMRDNLSDDAKKEMRRMARRWPVESSWTVPLSVPDSRQFLAAATAKGYSIVFAQNAEAPRAPFKPKPSAALQSLERLSDPSSR